MQNSKSNHGIKNENKRERTFRRDRNHTGIKYDKCSHATPSRVVPADERHSIDLVRDLELSKETNKTYERSIYDLMKVLKQTGSTFRREGYSLKETPSGKLNNPGVKLSEEVAQSEVYDMMVKIKNRILDLENIASSQKSTISTLLREKECLVLAMKKEAKKNFHKLEDCQQPQKNSILNEKIERLERENIELKNILNATKTSQLDMKDIHDQNKFFRKKLAEAEKQASMIDDLEKERTRKEEEIAVLEQSIKTMKQSETQSKKMALEALDHAKKLVEKNCLRQKKKKTRKVMN